MGPLIQRKKFFDTSDFTFAEVLKLTGIIVTAFILMGRLDTRLQRVEHDTVALSLAMAKMVDYVKNSDGYHSAIVGAQFENGKPINTHFDGNKIRKIITED